MNKFKRQVSGQFVHDTIPQSIDGDCPACQMKDVEIERLHELIQSWDKAINEVRIEEIEEFMNQVILNQFYNKDVLINFYRNWVKGLEDEKQV